MDRTRYTKLALAKSLIKALEEKPLEKVTVSDIISGCDISRMTFYRHFEDKYALANWIFSQYLDELEKRYREIECYKQLMYDILSFLYGRHRIFASLFSYMGQSSFSDFFRTRTEQYVAAQLKSVMNTEELGTEFAYMIWWNSCGVTAVIGRWLNSGCKESPEELAQIMIDCLPPQLREYFIPTFHDKWTLSHIPGELELFLS